MRLLVNFALAIVVLCLTAIPPAVAGEDNKKSVGSFPDYDYEVICYARNVFTQQGGSEGLASIAECKKGEEEARDYLREVWPKLLVTGRSNCAETARQFARGSYEKLRECVAFGLLASFKDGLLVRPTEKH